MTAPEYLLTVCSAILGLTCVALLLDAYRRTGELLTPWTMFIAMALVDIYVPAALFFPVGLELPPWLSLLARDMALPAVVLFTAAAAFFLWGYRYGSRFPPLMITSAEGWSASKWRTVTLALLVLGLYYSSLAAEISHAGSVGEFVSRRLMNRLPEPIEQTPWAALLASLRGTLLPLMLVIAGVAFARRHSWRMMGVLFPVMAAFTAATTMSRGSILTLLIGLAIVERARLQDLTIRGREDAAGEVRRTNRRILAVCLAGVLLFVGYGTTRNYLTAQAYTGQASLSQATTTELARFIRGEGFVGLIGVLDAYPRDVAFMKGQTIRDMLLLPVPRAIWPSKPSWYGIDDITRAMGWPPSTQSAVTMPGELYANFAAWGLPLMSIYGWLFGVMRGYRFDPVLRYIYAFICVPMMLPTFWMAFTGFVNQLTPVPILALALWFIFPRLRAERRVVRPAIA